MPIKSSSLVLSAFLFTACASDSTKPQPFLLDKSRTGSCQSEIEKSISELVNAKNLTISKDVFSTTSSLHLTNRRDKTLSKSPFANDLMGSKTVQIYKEDEQLFIGLVGDEGEIVKSKKLEKCP